MLRPALMRAAIYSLAWLLTPGLADLSLANPQSELRPATLSDVEFHELAPDPAVKTGRLKNGVRYAVFANAVPQGRASLRLAVRVGSLNETEEERGVAHFLEHLAFNGSRHFPSGMVPEYLQRLGMGIGVDANAATSYDRTVYQLELPDTKLETFARALTLFADIADGLSLTAESVEKERDIILSEARARDSTEMRARLDEMIFLLPQSRIAHREPIGLAQIISTVPRARIKAFYDAWYRPENLVVVAVGDFSPAEVESQLQATLANLQARAPARPVPDLGQVMAARREAAHFLFDAEASAVSLSISTVAPDLFEPDTAASRVKGLPQELALAVLNRRLAVLAQKQSSPFLSAQISIDTLFDSVRIASISANADPLRWPIALAAIEQELRRALEHGFHRGEMEEAMEDWRSHFEQTIAGASTWHSRGIADRLVDAILDEKVLTRPAADLALFEQALARITPEGCLGALREAWRSPAARQIFVTGNLKLAQPEAAILTAYRTSQFAHVSPWAEPTQNIFAYTDFGEPGEVIATRRLDDLDTTLVEFKNGVRLNLKRTDFEAGRIRVSVRVGGGRLTEPHNEAGLAPLAMTVMAQSGLRKHNAEDLKRLLVGKAVEVDFSVDDDAFMFSGATRQADLLLQLQLSSALLTDAGYRPGVVRHFREEMKQFYTNMKHDVDAPLLMDAARLLANGDPRFGVPDEATVLSRTADEVKAWLAPQFASGPIEIAMVGDLDIQAAIAATARTFGALPERAPKPAYEAERKVTYPEPPVTRSYTVDTAIDRGWVQVVWAATDGLDVQRSRGLNVLSAVLKDRLRMTLREDLGDTYSSEVEAQLSTTYPGYGLLITGASVAAARAKAVVHAIKVVGDSLAKHGVTADELARTKAPLLTSLRESMRDNQYWLQVLAALQEQPQRAEWARTRLQGYEAITMEELNALAACYLRSERAYEFVSLPRIPDPIGTLKRRTKRMEENRRFLLRSAAAAG